MPTTLTKVDGAVEDLRLATAGNGSGPATFSRVQANGASGGTWTEVSADAIPVIDRAVITSGRTPFAAISPATDRDVERCLQETRLNVREMKNLEHHGAVAGTGVSLATAEKNQEAYKKCVDEILAEGRFNGIFGPGIAYEFAPTAGLGGAYASHCLPVTNPGLTLCGAGRSTIFKKHASVGAAAHLVHVTAGDFRLLDCTLSAIAGLTHRALSITPSASIADIVVADIGVALGDILVLPAAGFIVNRMWFRDNAINGGGTYSFSQLSSPRLYRNGFDGALIIGTATEALESVRIVENVIATGDISLLRSGAYNSAIHKDVLIQDNVLASGDIIVIGLNRVTIDKNRLFAGGVQVLHTGMPSVQDLRLRSNEIRGGGGGIVNHGIQVTLDGAVMDTFELIGGSITNFNRHAVLITLAGTVLRDGTIAHVKMIDNSREVGGGGFAGILFNSSGAGGVQDTHICHNEMRNRSGAAADLQTFGVSEGGGGAGFARCFVYHNIIKGYKTTDVQVTANFTEVNAGTFDGGAAV